MLERGHALGRYLILEPVGRGGMGVVYAAYDPELDRRVAIKLLHRDASGERLLLEAKTMARLRHPNVVVVHDVGTCDGQVFVAMELVEGTTLTRWLETPRVWREIVDLFVGAGRGLAAAHALGIAHRDFKPDNVLIDETGRPLVGDFGLAQTVDGESSAAGSPAATAVRGTPAYMSPEQHAGSPADERSDQFSFCVALFEALYREPPFAAEPGGGVATTMALALEVVQGRLRPPSRARAAPARVYEVLVRGLASLPGDRYPSMEALLADLARPPRRWLSPALGLGALAVAGAAIAVMARGEDACAGLQGRLDGVWDGARRARLASAFAGTGIPDAAAVAASVSGRLDAAASSWIEAATASCRATRGGQISAAAGDLRAGCYERRRGQLRSLVDLLLVPDAPAVRRSLDAVAGLPPLSDCDDAAALGAVLPPPRDPAARRAVDSTRALLDDLQAQYSLGRYQALWPLAAAAAGGARALGYQPLVGEALYGLGLVETKLGKDQAAEVSLLGALEAADRGHDDAFRARAAMQLAWVVGVRLARRDEGRRWLRVARAALDRGGANERLAFLIDETEAQLLMAENEPAAAVPLLAAAVERKRRYYGGTNVDVAAAMMNLAIAYTALERSAEAEAQLRAALAYLETLGHAHPITAKVLTNLGVSLTNRGALDEALAVLERGLAMKEVLLGKDSAELWYSLHNIASVKRQRGEHAAAIDSDRRALALLERAYGPDHLLVSYPLTGIGESLVALGRGGEAVPGLERALALREKAEPKLAEETRALLARARAPVTTVTATRPASR